MLPNIMSHPAIRRATLENFAELAAFLASQAFEPTHNLSDIVQDATLYALEHHVPLQDALKRISKSYPYKQEVSIEFYADRQTEGAKFRVPATLHAPTPTEPQSEPDPAWLDMLYAKLEHQTQRAPTVVKRNYARRALLILDCLCDLVETEEEATGDMPSLIVSILECGRITLAPRGKLRQYVLDYLKKHNEPISDDYLRHNWMYLAEIANEIIQRHCKPKFITGNGPKSSP